MPYLLTPTGWRVLNEEKEHLTGPFDPRIFTPAKGTEGATNAVIGAARRARLPLNAASRAADVVGRGGKHIPSSDPNVVTVQDHHGKHHHFTRSPSTAQDLAKQHGVEVTQGGSLNHPDSIYYRVEVDHGNLNESQMELLESLYEDGYLTEEQIDEILAGLARVASSAAGAAGRGLAGATKRVGSAASAGARKVAGAAKAGVNAASAGARKVAGAATAGARKVVGKVTSAYHEGEADAAAEQAAKLRGQAARFDSKAARHRRAGEVSESQMELLESLYEDGYLTEEQLDEVMEGMRGALARVFSGAAQVIPGRIGMRAARLSAGLSTKEAERRAEKEDRKGRGQQNLNENSERHMSNFKKHAKLAAKAYYNALEPDEWEAARKHHLRAHEAFIHIPRDERTGEIMRQSKDLMDVADDAANRCGINDWKREK